MKVTFTQLHERPNSQTKTCSRTLHYSPLQVVLENDNIFKMAYKYWGGGWVGIESEACKINLCTTSFLLIFFFLIGYQKNTKVQPTANCWSWMHRATAIRLCYKRHCLKNPVSLYTKKVKPFSHTPYTPGPPGLL